MRNNPFWKRGMIRQAYKLAAGRITTIAIIAGAVCTLCAVGITAVSVF